MSWALQVGGKSDLGSSEGKKRERKTVSRQLQVLDVAASLGILKNKAFKK